LREYPSIISPLHLTEQIFLFKEERKTKKDIEEILQIEKLIKRYQLVEDFEKFLNGFIVLKGDRIIPSDLFGHGFQEFLILLFYMEKQLKSGEVILLDEPTAFMHPGYINKLVNHLIRIAKERDTQIFVATHSIDLIEAFLEHEERDFLKENLKFIRMFRIEDKVTGDEINYEKAKQVSKEIYMDLRGV